MWITDVWAWKKDVGILKLLYAVLYTFNKYKCNGGIGTLLSDNLRPGPKGDTYQLIHK